uniref:Uncharacterized protein n=1 Tax=Rhizophora mucronata TaxID=61149 RepID=A0A2P2PKE9_RHIMU
MAAVYRGGIFGWLINLITSTRYINYLSPAAIVING